MRRNISFVVLFSLFAFELVAQTEVPDSIRKIVSLDELVVSAPNITRMKDHLLIYPNEQQRKHTNDGYGVLKNLMIPGLIIDIQSNKVEAMGMSASLYINGQECDPKEISMIRPRDIEKIEYYDTPTGKYAKDKIAINFVLKQYQYGGYAQFDGLQTIGHTHGDYNAAGSVSKGNTTYSLFTGANYYHVNGNWSRGTESYFFPQEAIIRENLSETNYKKHNEYVQLRIQNQNKNRYYVGKISLVNSNTPDYRNKGDLTINKTSSQFESRTKQNNLSPKLDFNGNIPLSDTENLSFGLHGKYSHNTYDRSYKELPFHSEIAESEDVGEFQFSAIYDRYWEKSSFSTELYQYYNVWNAEYTGDNPLGQHLWQSESLAFMAYNYRFTKNFSIRSRLGLDWLQYRLHGCDKFSQLSPRINLNLQYQKNAGVLLWSFNYVNANHGMDVINNAMIDVNPYMLETGNPYLEKSHDINTYMYYSTKIKKVGITAMCQYKLEHNPVMHDYELDQNKIIKTYMNKGDIHYFSMIAAATYQLCENLVFSGDIRYNHTQVNARWNRYNNDLTGNMSINWYAGDFSVSPYVNFRQKLLDHTALKVRKVPINYGLTCSYSHKDFFVELLLVSPFISRKERSLLNTPYYTYNIVSRNKIDGGYCNIKCSYTFDFGRKTKKIKKDIDSNVNSSLLRVTL